MKLKRMLSISLLFSMIMTPGLYIDNSMAEKTADDVTIELPLVKESGYSMIKASCDIIEDSLKVVNNKIEKKYVKGYTTTSVNVRNDPSTDADILDTYSFNKKVTYTKYDEDWVEIKYGDGIAYMSKKYISKNKRNYIEYAVPKTSGFKSYMSYKCITSKGSNQYKLQVSKAYTGQYGIRQVDSRFCVAIGSHFNSPIGGLFDLVLENGTVIPCISADQKADKDTQSNNIITAHNGCMSEFIVDNNALDRNAKRMGDISYCNSDWRSPVKYVRVYK